MLRDHKKGLKRLKYSSLHLFRSTFSEFTMRHGKDARFKDIPKMRERETLFAEFVSELRKMAKEALQKKKDGVDEKVMSNCSFGGRAWYPTENRSN